MKKKVDTYFQPQTLVSLNPALIAHVGGMDKIHFKMFCLVHQASFDHNPFNQ